MRHGKMHEVSAAFGLLQLRHIDRALARRAEIDGQYRQRLSAIRGLHCLPKVSRDMGNHAYFPVMIDEDAYLATVGGQPLDLTYTEFELLKYLVLHPGRVFSREHLLADVWGYDYFGGTRTVDVHIRRLRAKLGSEHESLIGTVRNVGYRFSP